MAKNSSDPAVPTTTGSISPWCQCHSAVSLKTMKSALFFSNKKNHQETSLKTLSLLLIYFKWYWHWFNGPNKKNVEESFWVSASIKQREKTLTNYTNHFLLRGANGDNDTVEIFEKSKPHKKKILLHMKSGLNRWESWEEKTWIKNLVTPSL